MLFCFETHQQVRIRICKYKKFSSKHDRFIDNKWGLTFVVRFKTISSNETVKSGSNFCS